MLNDKKELICNAAIEVIEEGQYEEASVSMIMKKAGLAVGTFYNYFGCKDDIFQYIFEKEHGKRKEFLENNRKTDKSPLQQMLEFWEYHFRLLNKNPRLGRMLNRKVINMKNDDRFSITDDIKELMNLYKEAHGQELVDDYSPYNITIIMDRAVRGAMYTDTFLNGSTEEFDEFLKDLLKFIKNGLSKKVGGDINSGKR